MSGSLASVRHRRPPQPVHFPDGARVPEEKEHFELRALLYDILMLAFATRASIGSDQFVYWNGRDPKRCLAPDAFVYWGTPDEKFRSWKTWERGTPQIAVEIASAFDRGAPAWEAKLTSYQELGVRELVSFDAEAEPGSRLRVWDRVEDDLVEREVSDDATVCRALSGRSATTPELFWVVVSSADHVAALRLAEDAAGARLLPTAREAAERRIAELEAKLDLAKR
jgi:Uma2 family endonuclease